MFDAGGECDDRCFAARCADDRHHFRLIVSPEDATDLTDIRLTTRDLMAQIESDLGSKLDWIAVDHWNTDNPHVHILVRGRGDDGADLVISRDYLTRGLRARAEALVEYELGPRTAHEIATALERDVDADRFTGLDRTLRVMADDGGGIVNLRPGGPSDADRDMTRLLVGRATKLERLGLAVPAGPACWELKPGLEDSLRDLSVRGDIIKTMHRALARGGVDRGADLSLHLDTESPPVLGRLIERGLQDEIAGSAYAVIDGVDGRAHHLRFADVEATGDAVPGAIVELRRFEDRLGGQRAVLATRSDLSLADQVSSGGATWLDRQLVGSGKAQLSEGGFGRDVRVALDARSEFLVREGLAHRQGTRTVFAHDLVRTLRDRDLEATVSSLSTQTGRAYRPSAEGEQVSGTYTRRVSTASGRFAMLDDGLGFQLVPWTPALDAQFGKHVSGVVNAGGSVSWTINRHRGLQI